MLSKKSSVIKGAETQNIDIDLSDWEVEAVQYRTVNTGSNPDKTDIRLLADTCVKSDSL